MTISGFSYVRNGFNYDCPFIEAITSILPICDEFVVAVGDSTDGTREAIEQIGSPKIKIIDTTWDLRLRAGGKIFSQQTNLALDAIKGDWAFHIQADEVIHEKDLYKIKHSIEKENENSRIDGFILPFIHFWGDYYHYRNTRRVHKHEVRIFKNTGTVRSYRDSQGFRKYTSTEAYNNNSDKGKKLLVNKIDTPIFHYNNVRTPDSILKKHSEMGFFYGHEKKQTEETRKAQYDFNIVDRVAEFKDSHPNVMQKRIAAHPNNFVYDNSKATWVKKDKFIQPIEDLLGFKIGEYKNYIELK